MRKRGDKWLLVILSIVGVWMSVQLFGSGAPVEAAAVRIEVDGKLFETIEVTASVQFVEIPGYQGHNVLEISTAGVKMIEADCPDKLCLAMKRIHHRNEKIVCLPNRVFVEMVDHEEEGGGIDAVVQ
ncbi:NusG domain II-containing protein [Paenibacillus daejeonensis]|uniref:NusG domain II-containing protein n=1 Tax=Paenibacillus daejeonensis TaxID=135193 RepID=UPI000380FA26|nr:NusG domain II-containing protein [Paenibacillus daejeonensis]